LIDALTTESRSLGDKAKKRMAEIEPPFEEICGN